MTHLSLFGCPEQAMSARAHADGIALWERCCTALARYFSVRLAGNEHVVDDLMQQLWLRFAERGDGIRNADGEPWLWRVARNLLREHWRRDAAGWERRLRADPALAQRLARQFDSAPLPIEQLEREEVKAQLLLALSQLPSDEQELLVACYFESCSHAELARRFGTSLRGMEGRLYRARGALRDALAAPAKEL
ncbi:MAG: sigma-70 family RNA polymerase sigma factor [Phycisphaerales bacterium]|nr:sigma-70 family RNA polymerase sigma factor [Phycisphaerales bacterium]